MKEAWRGLALMPIMPRFAVVGAVLCGVAGGVVGLIIGLSVYAPTAWFAVFEIGLPAGILGSTLGFLLAGCVLVFRFLTHGTSLVSSYQGAAEGRVTSGDRASSLKDALLELGMEDVIPLPEILGSAEIESAPDFKTLDDVISALVALLRSNQVRVWSGTWPDEPCPVTDAVGEKLVRRKGQYQFNSVEDERLRVYFVNVANVDDFA